MGAIADLFVIGGGINGVGIARDAAGRGLNVILCEKADLASGTSSKSTKLIHGGLRYLEQYDFRLVRESLIERERLLRAAPHIIRPMRFILPYNKGLRPAFILRLGLFLYDHIGGRKLLPPTRTLRLHKDQPVNPLKRDFNLAFEYSDCQVDDARLVVLNAVDASERGARILTRTAFKSAHRQANGLWSVTVQRTAGHVDRYQARSLVNASGPWMTGISNNIKDNDASRRNSVKLVKGSHIIVKRWFDDESAYVLQNADGRIIFAIPYEQNYTLIGTTDIPYESNLDEILTTEDEISYLCTHINDYFQMPIKPEDVIHSYSGVRPLYDDGSVDASVTTRDYVFDLTPDEDGAPLLSIYGGKLTTYRKLAEHAIQLLQPRLKCSNKSWTASSPLPGGDIPRADFESITQVYMQRYGWLPLHVLSRLLRAYGSRLELVLDDANSIEDLGEDFDNGLYEKELDYLVRYEFAKTAEDILWRRSKLGLVISESKQARLESWLQNPSMQNILKEH